MEGGGTWQQAVVRELWEETEIAARLEDVRLRQVSSGLDDNTLLLFALVPALPSSALLPFQPSDEVTERLILREPVPLAFPLHEAAVRAYLERSDRRLGGAG